MFYEKCTQGRPNTSVAGLLNGSGLLCSPRAVFIFPFYARVLQAPGLTEWRREECVNETFSSAYSKKKKNSPVLKLSTDHMYVEQQIIRQYFVFLSVADVFF